MNYLNLAAIKHTFAFVACV